MVVLVVVLLLCCAVDTSAGAGCNGMCEACVQRYGCMTPAWGRCCTQFYQHNGRKRNAAAPLDAASSRRLTPHPQPPPASAATTRMSKTGAAAKSLTPWVRTRRTRHRASTNMYSLTFCVRFLLPERHLWKPAFQTAAVMLRTPPVGGRSPAGRPRPLPVCGARFWGRPPVARRSPAGGARRPRPAGRSHYDVISRDERKLVVVTRIRVMLP